MVDRIPESRTDRVLTARVRRADGDAIVALEGELDISSAPIAERALAEAERDAPSRVVADLRALRFLDSTGLRTIISADQRARAGGWRLVLVPGHHAVHRVFTITALDRRLVFVDPDEVGTTTGSGSGGPERRR